MGKWEKNKKKQIIKLRSLHCIYCSKRVSRIQTQIFEVYKKQKLIHGLKSFIIATFHVMVFGLFLQFVDFFLLGFFSLGYFSKVFCILNNFVCAKFSKRNFGCAKMLPFRKSVMAQLSKCHAVSPKLKKYTQLSWEALLKCIIDNRVGM